MAPSKSQPVGLLCLRRFTLTFLVLGAFTGVMVIYLFWKPR